MEYEAKDLADVAALFRRLAEKSRVIPKGYGSMGRARAEAAAIAYEDCASILDRTTIRSAEG